MKELSLDNCRLDRRYDVGEQLGRGSYAEIYLARDVLASPQSPHSQVVIKALNVFLQDDLDADLERTLVENFQNEAVALDRVRHPNIISRLGHGTARDLRGTVFHYLVLEYLSGGDLQSLLRKKKMPLQQALTFVEQICAGLGHAHEHAIIHRDIKPQNLLLNAAHSTVKIADFGVARVSVADSPITRVGTNIYAPPEHSPMSAGHTGSLEFTMLTPSADIYSLAKTIYTLLTGDSPRTFANSKITSLPENVRDEKWAEDLIRALTKSTDDDPRKRHQTVDEFWADLLAVRNIAGNGEFATVMKSDAIGPQPHVSRGYTPIAPAKPAFEPVTARPVRSEPPTPLLPEEGWPKAGVMGAVGGRDLTMGHTVDRTIPSLTRPGFTLDADGPVMRYDKGLRVPITKDVTPPVKKRRRVRGLATLIVVVAIFAGILYGTAAFMRNRGILPDLGSLFTERTGVANRDIYLRPSPNTDNEPIGLVTKNSKVRIVKSQNNWYQVDVVEQGRDRPSEGQATRGWLNGRYLDLSSN